MGPVINEALDEINSRTTSKSERKKAACVAGGEARRTATAISSSRR